MREPSPNHPVHVIGLEGGRLDHTWPLLALIEAESDAVMHVSGGDLRRIPTGGMHTVPAEPGMIIGLHPYGEVQVIHLAGVTWALEDVVLTTGTQGVHNVAKGAEGAHPSRLRRPRREPFEGSLGMTGQGRIEHGAVIAFPVPCLRDQVDA